MSSSSKDVSLDKTTELMVELSSEVMTTAVYKIIPTFYLTILLIKLQLFEFVTFKKD
jgi:hypothetical protein